MGKQTHQDGAITISTIVAIVMSVLFVFSLMFGLVAFTGKQSLQKDFDTKVEATIGTAVSTAEAKQAAEFAEKEKSPTKTYIGTSTFGSVTFNYPKSYSGYVVEAASSGNSPLDGYFQPGVVPVAGLDAKFALRFQVLSAAYDLQLKEFDLLVKAGKVKISPFRAAAVPSALGIRVDGELSIGKQGSLIVLPLRDKTLRIWTKSSEGVADFNKYVVPSLSFVP